MAAPLPKIITIVRELLHDGDLDGPSAIGFADLENRASMGSDYPGARGRVPIRSTVRDLTEPDAIGRLVGTIEVKQALSSA